MDPFLKNKAFVICGAGRFGSRALNLLSQDSKPYVTIIDHDPEKLSRIKIPSVVKIQADLVGFPARKQSALNPDSIIIPAVPFHLAFKWLITMIQRDYNVQRLDIPPGIRSVLPHPWQGSQQELICSYADFICPEDCPEPKDICTMTGKARGIPLFELMAGTKAAGFQTGVIRSRQIKPGVGGYAFKEILVLKERIVREGAGKWLIGTACRCHGILSAFEMVK